MYVVWGTPQEGILMFQNNSTSTELAVLRSVKIMTSITADSKVLLFSRLYDTRNDIAEQRYFLL